MNDPAGPPPSVLKKKHKGSTSSSSVTSLYAIGAAQQAIRLTT